MSNLNSWIQEELYPSLFEVIPGAFPEFEFKRTGKGWQSTNKTKVTGEEGDSKGKVYIYENAPWRLKDYTRDYKKDLIGYVMDRDQVETIEAVKHLAEKAGLQVPRDPSYDPKAHQKAQEQASIYEECQSYFSLCLQEAKTGPAYRDYTKSRGYSLEEAQEMGLGYIPSQDQLYKHLTEKGYTGEQIAQLLTFDKEKRIGTSHSLTIPYRAGGSIKGFKFRTIGQDKPKYLNSSGLEKDSLFNLSALKGDKDLTIVEGELDCLHASVKGIKNVVALAGNSLSSSMVQDALKRGAKRFTLCLDRETGKEAETAQTVSRAIDTILAEGVNRVYTVTLPALGDKTDPDSLLREQVKEALQKAIDEASLYYTHKLTEVIKPYRVIQKERYLTDKEIDSLLDEIVNTGSRISEPTDRDRFKKLFTDQPFTKGLGISEDSFSETVERLTTTRQKEAQRQGLNRLLSKAKDLQDKGEAGQAIELLETGLRELKTQTATGLLPPAMSFKALLDDIANLPEAKRTGYPSLDAFAGFPPGAITLIAGRPSHGKTTLMFNLLLQMSQASPKETFYFFTYEEPKANILVKLLNRMIDKDLGKHYSSVKDLSRLSNFEFIKAYVKSGRSDITEIEQGKEKLGDLMDSQRVKVIDIKYSVEGLDSLLRLQSKQENIGAVFIDYIQKMRTAEKTQDKRTYIAHISDQILQTAKETGLPIILGAQINRSATGNEGKKPRLENLKEAGNLEEDANTVLSVYNEDREALEPTGNREVELEIKALKNREGESNKKTILTFDTWTGAIKEQAINSGIKFKQTR